MKKIVLLPVIAFSASFLMISCETKKEEMTDTEVVEEPSDSGSAEIEETDVVESGTYKGTAKEVDPEEKEIYVETPDGKILELYFTDSTQLKKGGEEVTFDKLVEGGNVEVTVEKKGNRLEPISVMILD